MPQQEITGTKISAFPAAAASDINPSDVVAGVGDGINKKFSFAAMLAWIKARIEPSDIGAIPSTEKGVADGVATLDANGKVPGTQLDLSGKQDKITASGILKGDGAGGVSAAVAGTDYGTYSKPSGGIPSSDMTFAVQTSLGKADSAYQKPSGGIPASDLANGVIPSVPSPSDSTPQALGTAAAGSSGNYSRADHVHQKPTYSKSDVGLGNVANELQYSANNPPPYPVTSVNGNTGAVTVSVPSISTSTPNMDGTGAAGSTGQVSDAGHTHPSDTSKANQAQLAYVESGTTASRAYAVDDLFCFGGQLCKAKTAISSGGTFTPGTNCEQVTGGGFNHLRNLIHPSSITLTYSLIGVSLVRASSSQRKLVITVPYGYTSVSVSMQSANILTREFGSSAAATFSVTSVTASLSGYCLSVTLNGTGLESAMDVLSLDNGLVISLS